MPATTTLFSRGSPLASGAEQVRLLDAAPGEAFERRVARAGLPPLRASGIRVLQANLGRICNLTCRHCHVDAGPDRTESMSDATVDLVLATLARTDAPVLDITGGAPELHPRFRRLVEGARALSRRVIDRCNLTVLLLEGCRDLVAFLARHGVEIVASLPFFVGGPVDAQRGSGVFSASLRALRRLNDAGYGVPGTGLVLDLVHNPTGAFLPPPQSDLEARYRDALAGHGISFTRLLSLANMPIARFLEFLLASGNLDDYLARLACAFNPDAVAGAMCRTTLSVGWDGSLFDCDFNQMLGLPLADGAPRHLREFDLEAVASRPIVTGRHCFGCTAGAGSSCGGATT